MNSFWEIVASNSLVAVVLAVGVALLGRVWKNPVAIHFLWVIVLVKLMTPPVVTLPVALSPGDAPPASSEIKARQVGADASLVDVIADALDMPPGEPIRPVAAGTTSGPEVVENSPVVESFPAAVPTPIDWPKVLLVVWGLGIALLACGNACRILRFQRVLRTSEDAPRAIARTANTIGTRLGLRRPPRVAILPIRCSPLVWFLGGRACILLPATLFERLDADAQEAILAHELAHVFRRDHWVRLLELLVTTLFWWHPVVWYAARRLRDLEEQCCDGLALSTVAHGPKAYAVALLDTLDFLSERPLVAPAVATATRSHASVARRIEMLKNGAPVVRLTVGRLLLLSALAAVPMPVSFASAPPESDDKAASAAQPPVAEPAVQKRAVNKLVKDFPDKVDLSTPESALAAWARKLADKQVRAANELSWVKLDAEVVKDVEEALKHDRNAPKDIKENALNVEILDVFTYRDDLAAVICKNPGPGEKLYGCQLVCRIFGIWKCFAAFDVDPEVPGMFAARTRGEAVEKFKSEKEKLWGRFVKIREEVINGPPPTISVARAAAARNERAAAAAGAKPAKAEAPGVTAGEDLPSQWKAMRNYFVAYPFSFIEDPDVRKGLKLTSEQERRLQDISADYPAEWQEFLRQLPRLSPQEREKRQAELKEKQVAAGQVLTQRQKTILESVKPWKWTEVMLWPRMSEKLGLSDEQRHQLARLHDEIETMWRQFPDKITDRWVFEKERAMHEALGSRTGREFLAALGVPTTLSPAVPEAEKERESRQRSSWQMNIGLDTTGLAHEAIQWVIFDEDPVPDFQARVRRMRSYYRNKIDEAADADAKEMQRSIGMKVSWDLCFKQITGDQLFLLTAGSPHGVASSGIYGRKWIVTKCGRIDGKTACWCIPVDVKTGESIDVWLTEDNLFDLSTAFNEALWASDASK